MVTLRNNDFLLCGKPLRDLTTKRRGDTAVANGNAFRYSKKVKYWAIRREDTDYSITFNDYPHMGGWDATTGVGPKQVGENPLNRNRKLLFVTVERYSLNL